MIDHIFGALLTFCLLAGGTFAVGSAMLDFDAAVHAAQQTAVRLPAVEVKRTTIAQTAPAEPTASNPQ
jgi:hypothetical protein